MSYQEKEKEKEPEPTVPKNEPNRPDNIVSETISLRVVGQDGGEILFRIKSSTPLAKLMNAYCQRMAVSTKAMRFLYDGKRVNETDTASMLKMTDNDIVDAVLQQVGGC